MRMPWLKREVWPFKRQLFLHLRTKSVHQHELDAHRVENGEVLGERGQLAGGHQFARDGHHEGLSPVRVDVRRNRTEPRNEGMGKDKTHGRRDALK